MNRIEVFNQTEKEIKELETVEKVLYSAMEKEQLQERKERILECMKSPAYVPMKRKDMRVLLGVPEEDQTYFEQIIAELIDEGKIFETKRGKLPLSSFCLIGTNPISLQRLWKSLIISKPPDSISAWAISSSSSRFRRRLFSYSVSFDEKC